jgi:hypothetical protein
MEILKAAATASGCGYERFSQRAVLNGAGVPAGAEGANGICFGLAVVWLESKLKRQQDVLLDAYFPRSSGVFSRAHLLWAGQDSAMWKSMTGLTEATQSDGSAKSKDFDCGADELPAFCNWLASSRSERYFVVKTPTHAMAACGSRDGPLEFFEPNGGLVSSRTAGNLSACLASYFSDALIKDKYKQQPQNRVVLQVAKFKKA